jgi:hypothetical protein
MPPSSILSVAAGAADHASRQPHVPICDDQEKNGARHLRLHGRLHHIGIGRTHARTCVILLIQDLHVRVINAATGELLRELVIDPTRDYQPTGRPPGPQKKTG